MCSAISRETFLSTFPAVVPIIFPSQGRHFSSETLRIDLALPNVFQWSASRSATFLFPELIPSTMRNRNPYLCDFLLRNLLASWVYLGWRSITTNLRCAFGTLLYPSVHCLPMFPPRTVLLNQEVLGFWISFLKEERQLWISLLRVLLQAVLRLGIVHCLGMQMVSG